MDSDAAAKARLGFIIAAGALAIAFVLFVIEGNVLPAVVDGLAVLVMVGAYVAMRRAE